MMPFLMLQSGGWQRGFDVVVRSGTRAACSRQVLARGQRTTVAIGCSC